MEAQKFSLQEDVSSAVRNVNTISKERARQICKEEELDYTDEELVLILDFISKVIGITTSHYERTHYNAA